MVDGIVFCCSCVDLWEDLDLFGSCVIFVSFIFRNTTYSAHHRCTPSHVQTRLEVVDGLRERRADNAGMSAVGDRRGGRCRGEVGGVALNK